MSTQRINAAEKDLEKFIKFLTLKSVQVVVQSRLGEKFQTQCNPLATGNDWFNIVINDHPDVAAETKHALALKPGDSILQRLPVSVEISLKTVDGDQMVLEVWSIDLQMPNATTNNGMQQQQVTLQQQQQQRENNFNKDTVDAAAIKGVIGSEQQLIKASHAIYNRMGILLKSLITLTRTTPAYKLSRRQCPDSYDIYYRVYVDRPQIHTLGEGYKQVRIGQLNTIVGTLSMSVAYRTKMTFTPTTAQTRNGESNNAIMVKSDHFRPATNSEGTLNSPNGSTGVAGVGIHNNNNNNNNNNAGNMAVCMKKGTNDMGIAAERKIIDIDKPLRPGAFTDIGKLRQFTEEDYVLPETPPFEWLLQRVRTDSSNYGGSVESLNYKCESPINTVTTGTAAATIPFGNGYQQQINIINNNNNNSNNNKDMNYNNNNNNNNMNALNQNYNNNKCNNNNNNNNEGMTTTTTAVGAGQQQLSSRLSQSPPIKSLLVPVPPSTRHMRTISPAAVTSPYSTQNDDDNLLKELNFPFASSTSHVNDLAKFYRDCYHAPPLRGLGEITTNVADVVNNSSNVSNNINNTAAGNSNNSCSASAFAMTADTAAVDDLSRQLEQFETSLEDYDKLVSQFGLSGSSSTGSRSSGGLQMSN